MKYLSFVRMSESFHGATPPAALMEAMGEFITRSLASGVLVSTGGLKPSKDGFRIRVDKGVLAVTDGPFTEAKEVIGGYAILSCSSREEAMRVSTEFMELHRKYWPELDFESEVRPMEEMG